MTARAGPSGFNVLYSPGCVNASCLTTDGFPAAAATAAKADAVVLFLGMGVCKYGTDSTACEAEGHDRPTCALPGGQPALVDAVRAAVRPGVPLVAVFIHGGTFCLLPSTVAALDAILDAWYPGMRGAAAISDALLGVYSPSGRTPVTWYASDAALPADRGQMSPYPNASNGSPGLTYRFYDPQAAGGAPPVFTFGEGYGYTTFAASAPVAPSTAGPCDDIPVSVTVTNTGGMDSDVVVTLFVSQTGLAVPAPAQRLVGFTRTFIPAGQAVSVSIGPVTAKSRSVIVDADGDIFQLAGKRWNEAGVLQFRVSLGGHGEASQGGLPFNVTQTASQDLFTC